MESSKDALPIERGTKMTLADFLKVFDFENNYLEIRTLDLVESISAYFSKVDVEHDFCTRIYNVIDIRPVDSYTVQITINY